MGCLPCRICSVFLHTNHTATLHCVLPFSDLHHYRLILRMILLLFCLEKNDRCDAKGMKLCTFKKNNRNEFVHNTLNMSHNIHNLSFYIQDLSHNIWDSIINMYMHTMWFTLRRLLLDNSCLKQIDSIWCSFRA